jgi:hypothetical protein
MKKQQIEESIKYPSYRLLPWEEDEVIKYAKESRAQHTWYHEKGKTEQDLTLRARLGRGGEIAFKGMFLPEKQSMILDAPSDRKDFDSPHDFIIKGKDKDYKVDIKTSGKTEKVTRPEDCNFLWSIEREQIKDKQDIKLCDIYVQMFCDPDEFVYYFIGAISLEKINEVRGGVRLNPGLGLIRQNEMDYTETFLKYMDKLYR